jgi:glycosyl transferase family 25
MDINKYFDKIFYINLAKDIDRNNNLLAQFNKYGITNYERFEAISVNEIPEPKYFRNFNKINDKYILNSLACRESHVGVIKIAKEKGYGKILILEDDIEIIENPNELLRINESILNDWDLLYFGGLIENFFRNQIVCAHAYAVRHKAYDDIINMAIPSGMEIDNFYAKILQHMSLNSNQSGKYNVRITMPFNTIVQNKQFESNIQ